MNWQPIETAPKDGTTVIAFMPSEEPSLAYCAGAGRSRDGGDWWVWTERSYVGRPTHWMPLPAPPKTED